MSDYPNFGPEEVRYYILNAKTIKKDLKCLTYDGTGQLNWNGETGDDVKPGKIPLEQYGKDDRTDGDCEECFGIGYRVAINDKLETIKRYAGK
jgi:hypothetical protein